MAAQSEPWSRDSAPSRLRNLDLLSLLPLLAILVLSSLIWSLVWTVSRDDSQSARIKLATDALWVEQTLRFRLDVDEDMLVGLALDQSNGIDANILAARARSFLATSPEVISLTRYDGEGRLTAILPGADAPSDPDLVAQVLANGTGFKRVVYGKISPDGLVSMGLPLADRTGVLLATISLPNLLERHLPWWIAEQYGVELVDYADEPLASRQRLAIDPATPSHKISFDPPLAGAWLKISAYHRAETVFSSVLFAALAGLAAFAILALGVLYWTTKRRRETEIQLLGETAFRRSMEESLTVGLRAKDHEGRILFVNPAFCQMVGWSASELIGHAAPMPYWDPEILPETEARQRKLAAGGAVSQRFETRFVRSDGRKIDIEVFEAPLIDARGRHRGWMGSVIDITETRQAERKARLQDEALAHTGRLVTLGEMASTLAHELNQPLSAIASYAAGMLNLMQRPEADPALLKSATEKLAHQAGRAGLIIRRIQDLVKKREPKFTDLNLAQVIDETMGFLRADARDHRVNLRRDGGFSVPVNADRILLEQVLINLIRNGMESMTEKRHGDHVIVRLSATATSAIIDVEDCGAGIADALVDKIYDAFASTKPQGMGMGLKICRSIIELHGGNMEHLSRPGGGTIFRVTLPLTRVQPPNSETLA